MKEVKINISHHYFSEVMYMWHRQSDIHDPKWMDAGDISQFLHLSLYYG